jgi:hypothetical protein
MRAKSGGLMGGNTWTVHEVILDDISRALSGPGIQTGYI